MNHLEKYIKKVVILCILEIIALSFAIVYGLENGFKLWNWLVIIIGALICFVFTIVVIIKENKGIKKVSKEELAVTDFYREQARLILNVIDEYLNTNQKVANDLRLYWPFYKGLLKRIANGKKYAVKKDYEIIEQLAVWQKENYEDAFLLNIYDVLTSNLI